MKNFFNFIRINYIPANLPERKNWGLALTPLAIAFILLVLEYYGWQRPFLNMSRQYRWFPLTSANDLTLYAQIFTSASFLLLLVIAPIGLHFLAPSKEENPFGLALKDITTQVHIYAPLVFIMLPILWIASGFPSFNQFYPLYKPTAFNMLLLYESIYIVQFFCVEFFFRGSNLYRLEKIVPGYAVFIMTIPYALIHIHKPFPEAVASIIAGIILGFLSLKSRSIWPGVIVHCCIALSIDLFSLIQTGQFLRLL